MDRDGIPALYEAIVSSVVWETSKSFPSLDILELMIKSVDDFRANGRYLTSLRELYDEFKRAHPYALHQVSEEGVFRDGIQLLEVLGHLELFDERDEIVLDPRFYHGYASAMISGAARDTQGMGRLPLHDAETGSGKQMTLSRAERIADWKQDRRLLALTINELISGGVAQRVSAADSGIHLVFPSTLTRLPDGSHVRPRKIGAVRFTGKTQEVFSSLVVNFLGLPDHYPNPDLYKDEAMFSTPSGSRCGIVLTPNPDGNEAVLAMHCDDRMTEIERNLFVNRVRTHIQSRDRDMEINIEETVAIDSGAGSAGYGGAGRAAIEVYLCWEGSPAESATQTNVRSIANQLRGRGFTTVGDNPADAGLTMEEHLAHIDRSVVALVLMGGDLSEEQQRCLRRLGAVGCRLIPVILPTAPKEFSMPSALMRWKRFHDLRKEVVDVDLLASDLKMAFERGRVPKAAHVFLSYSRSDHAAAASLVTQLEEAGHVVWWDHGHAQPGPGSDWENIIRQAIRESYAFIWCASEESLDRQRSWVYPELSEATDVQKTLRPGGTFIITVRLSACQIPDLPVGSSSLRRLQWFDYFRAGDSVAGLVWKLDEARRQAVSGPPLNDTLS
jgi:hypothetical protein